MKLYYAPGACSLADHIALHEAGLDFEHVRVNLKTKTADDGSDFATLNPKGYVPVLVLDDGDVITENVAILDWIAGNAPRLVPRVKLARTRLLEALAFISSEVHKNFAPFFKGASDDEKAAATKQLQRRFATLADQMGDNDYLFGDEPTVADCYLFVMTMWAGKNDIALPGALADFRERMKARPAVATALQHEELG